MPPRTPGAIIIGYRRSWIDAVWSSRDPQPFLMQWSQTAREGWSAWRQGRHHQIAADRTRPPE